MENTIVEMPDIGDGMFTTMLCVIGIIPFLGPIIGLIYGIINVKHRFRMRKARILIIVAIATFIGHCLAVVPEAAG